MLKDKRKTPPGFNSSQSRFKSIGLHPHFKAACLSSGLAPSKYQQIDPPQKINGIDWSVKQRVEEFSKTLGYRNRAVLEDRAFRRSLGGPASGKDIATDVDYTIRPPCGGSGTGSKFLKACRFRDPKNVIPDSTTYYPQLPATIVPPYKGPPKPYTERFPLDRKSSRGLGPGIYNVKSPLDQFVSKRTSILGPYRLFTGKRDESTIFGYQASKERITDDLDFYPLPTSLEEFTKRPRYGLFLKDKRFGTKAILRIMLKQLAMMPRNPSDPGPGHYNQPPGCGALGPHCKLRERPCIHPFNMSVRWARPIVRRDMIPGPGRYAQDVKQERWRTIPGRGHSYVFKSTVARTGGAPPRPVYNSF